MFKVPRDSCSKLFFTLGSSPHEVQVLGGFFTDAMAFVYSLETEKRHADEGERVSVREKIHTVGDRV